MAFDRSHYSNDDAPMAEINMIPLIDIMLVLLVIFIITAPLLTHAVKIDLPRASSHPNITKPENIQLGIRADGSLFWNGESTDAATLKQRLTAAASLSPPPELHIRADTHTEYRHVAEVMALSSRTGISRIGFVSDPAPTKEH